MEKGVFDHRFPNTRYTTNKIIAIIILLLLVIFSVYVSYERDCGSNKACFDRHTKECTPSKLNVNVDDNIYLYGIKGKSNGNCIMQIELKQMKPGTDLRTVKLFEKKSMRCTVPKEQLFYIDLVNNPNLIDYCSGPLKEAMYEFMIKKLYGNIAQNMGSILKEVNNALNQTV